MLPTLPDLDLPPQVSKKRQIYTALLARIQDQSLPFGTRLPSTSALAEEWRVAHATAHAALNELTRDGWLVRSPKQGTFVSAPPKNRLEPVTRTASIVLPPREDVVMSGNGDELLEILQGFTEGARAVDWQIRIESISSMPTESEQQRAGESIRSASMAIFFGHQYKRLIEQLAADDFPTMTLISDPGVGSAITYDRPAAVRMAVDHLIGKGYRKIGYFGNTLETDPKSKFISYRNFLKQEGLELKGDWIGHCASHRETREKVREFLHKRPKCDALLVANYRFACLLVQEAAQCGIRIPDDLAIVANGIEGSHIHELPLTYVRIPFLEFGIEVMKWISARIETPGVKEREFLTLKPSLIARQST